MAPAPLRRRPGAARRRRELARARSRARDLVYIWCVTFGVVPLLARRRSARSRRDFWNRRTAALAAARLVCRCSSRSASRCPSTGSSTPSTFLRRLRYPIKFYLLTTLCVALLAGLAAEAARRRARAPERREACADRGRARPLRRRLAGSRRRAGSSTARPAALRRGALDATRRRSSQAFRSAWCAATRSIGAGRLALVLALVLRRGSSGSPAWALGFADARSPRSSWGLPLFVAARRPGPRPRPRAVSSASQRARAASTSLPRFPASRCGAARAPSRRTRCRARAASRASSSSSWSPATGVPVRRAVPLRERPRRLVRLLQPRSRARPRTRRRPSSATACSSLYGARWALATGRTSIRSFARRPASRSPGERLVLFENPQPVPELRWAGRAWTRSSLSEHDRARALRALRPRDDVAAPRPRATRTRRGPPAPAAVTRREHRRRPRGGRRSTRRAPGT